MRGAGCTYVLKYALAGAQNPHNIHFQPLRARTISPDIQYVVCTHTQQQATIFAFFILYSSRRESVAFFERRQLFWENDVCTWYSSFA